MNQNISVLVISYDCSWDEISYLKMMVDNKDITVTVMGAFFINLMCN